MDPISIVLARGVAGGVGGKLAEKAIDYLHDLVRGQSGAVKEAAAKNALSMLLNLQARLRLLEKSVANAALRNPDVATTLRAGVVGAARTGEQSKHRLIARAVAERAVANDESTHALASNLAVEVLLTVPQLSYLAIASLVYSVRPEGLPLAVQAV